MTRILLSASTANNEQSFLIAPGEYTLGRSSKASLEIPQSWMLVSGLHLSLKLTDMGELYVRDGVNEKKSRNGTKLNNRYLNSKDWTAWHQGDELQIGSDSSEAIHLEWINENEQRSQSFTRINSNYAKSNLIRIGRSDDCDIRINGPTISRLHAVIRRTGMTSQILDRSKNGVYVNDKRVDQAQALIDGDTVKLGTHIFRWRNDRLTKETSGRDYRIDCRDLTLAGRISGTSISIEPGQLVAFVGGSGAGKSSLLTTIVGQNMSYQGHIYINGIELRDCYSAIKQEIGFVPQDDIVHAELTVEEVLRYSARLKLPDPEQQRAGVERVLRELEMDHRRHARVKDLSGGQRKRVSIGVELIADPRILFLDEPTSGLDPGLDKRMMQLLRQLADHGKTVALVTHATNNVMLCDQVIFLGRGGHLCYAGPPDKCASYFGINGDFADIYQHLEKTDQEIIALANRFKQVSQADLPLVQPSAHRSGQVGSSSLKQRLRETPGQLKTLISRDTKLLGRDLTSLVLNAITAPLAGAMIAIAANNRSIFSDYSNLSETTYPDALRILFVIMCSTIWVGLSSSLQTIVKERPIFIRERAFNLLPEAYLGSKLILMAGQGLIQSLLIAVSVSLLFEAPADVDNWALNVAIITFATLFSIGSQALMVSSIVRNSQQASSIAPLLLIPQLVFGGVLFILKDGSKDIYPLITSRWAMRGMGSISEITNLIPGGKVAIAQIAGAADYEATAANITESFQVLAVQSLTLTIATLLILLFYKRNR